MDNLHDLFEHELKDIYDAESRLVDALQKQASESSDATIKAAFQAHHKETVRQKDRLEKVFDAWGKEPSRGEGCAGIKGLLKEHDDFKEEEPSKAIMDVFNLTAAAKVERYEITAYTSLIRLATQMGLDDVVDLLAKNLEEEEATLEKVEALSDADDRLEGIAVEKAQRAKKAETKSSRAR